MINPYEDDSYEDCLKRTNESLCKEIYRLRNNVEYLKGMLKDIAMLNSRGKTLKIHDAVYAALENCEV
jgi:hypothetical protein